VYAQALCVHKACARTRLQFLWVPGKKKAAGMTSGLTIDA